MTQRGWSSRFCWGFWTKSPSEALETGFKCYRLNYEGFDDKSSKNPWHYCLHVNTRRLRDASTLTRKQDHVSVRKQENKHGNTSFSGHFMLKNVCWCIQDAQVSDSLEFRSRSRDDGGTFWFPRSPHPRTHTCRRHSPAVLSHDWHGLSK